MTHAAACIFSLAAALALLGAPPLRAQDVVPEEFRGDWVPAAADCESPLRFRVTADQMTLMNGSDVASYGDVAIAYSFFGPDYDGISVVSMPEFNSGNPPFTVTFNADEAPGVTEVEIYQEIAGLTNAAVEAIQDAARKLAGRFPLSSVPLKKCPGR